MPPGVVHVGDLVSPSVSASVRLISMSYPPPRANLLASIVRSIALLHYVF